MNLNDALSSEIHRKIVLFFNENQASIDTSRGVSTWIREDRTRVKKALEDLVACKVLIAYRVSSTTGYGYTTNRTLISKIGKLLKKFQK
jgi:hypothetical protein